jgi:hypothetical protein
MFFYIVDFSIEDRRAGEILIESDTRAGCIEWVAEFVRNVLGGPDGGDKEWRGLHGIIRCLIDAEKLGYTVVRGRNELNVPDDYFKNRTSVGYIRRSFSPQGFDGFDVTFYDGKNASPDSDLYDAEKGMPDFAACADKIAACVDVA